MAVYRVGNGIWSSSNNYSKSIHPLKSLLSVRNIILDSKYLPIIDVKIASIKYQLLPKELQKTNLNNFVIEQYLSHSIHLKVLMKSILLKFKNAILKILNINLN